MSTPHYALALLTVVYVFNFVDRQILAILLEPIRRDLGVSDSAMGFLTGPAFALFYTFAGIPIARWADRGVRRDILAIGLALWSAMTAMSGLAVRYWQLAIARIGVGVGEAACVPTSHSLIADYFPPERRASAMAIFSCGISLGIMAGFVVGGWMSESLGWRSTFFVVGLPGLALALWLRLSLAEPERSAGARVAQLELGPSLAVLWGSRTFRHVCLGAGIASLVGYALLTWTPAYLERTFRMPRAEIGLWLGLISGIGGGIGTILGGVLADRWSRRDPRWQAWIPAIGRSLSLPCFVLFTQQTSATAAMCWLFPGMVFAGTWFGPVFSLTQGLVPPSMRAFASAVLLFVVNVIGLGLGPQIVGVLSDSFGLRTSLLCVSVFEVWAAFHFWRASRGLVLDTRALAT